MELREMLELAALAAGVDAARRVSKWDLSGTEWFGFATGEAWAPHLDDGDSRRLQVASGIDMYFGGSSAYAEGWLDDLQFVHSEWIGTDPAAAARVAVLHVAAQMGKVMKEKDK